MAANHTPYLHLSQWEASDPVLRADFNADNLKIEHAFRNFRSAELICSKKAEAADITELLLDISKVDWSRYFALYMDLRVKMQESLVVCTDAGDDYCYGYFDGNTHVYPYLALFRPAGHGFVVMRTAYSGDTLLSMFSFAFGNGTSSSIPNLSIVGGSSPHPYREISRLTIRHLNSKAFLEGSTVDLWGIR
ncbi:MAG: hypothetical protein HFF56_00635 [Lawsonibacter sp.]|nr:hypothetical protein [Lawsonibacter sp.]